MILYGPSYGLGVKVNLQINKYTRKGMEKQKARFSGRNITTHTGRCAHTGCAWLRTAANEVQHRQKLEKT